MNIGLLLILLIFAYSIYIIWANIQVGVRQETNFYRLERFEKKLQFRPREYDCIVVEPGKAWTRASYIDLRDQIIESPGFIFRYVIPVHHYGVKFSLKAVEADKILYVALGVDAFDWESPKARMERRNFETTRD